MPERLEWATATPTQPQRLDWAAPQQQPGQGERVGQRLDWATPAATASPASPQGLLARGGAAYAKAQEAGKFKPDEETPLQRIVKTTVEPFEGIEAPDLSHPETLTAQATKAGVQKVLAGLQGGLNATAQTIAEALKAAGMEPNSADRLARDIKASPEAFAGTIGGARAPTRVKAPVKVAEEVKPATKAAKEVVPNRPAPGLDTATPPATPEAPGAASPAHAAEGPQTRPPALDKPREMEDQLHQLRNLEAADRLDALTALKKLPEDYTPELDEKLYHHEENPTGVPLAAREKAIYDEHVAPIRQEANALGAELEKITGVKPDLNDIYTPRYVAGRTRSYGESIAQFFKGVEARFGGASSRTMRKTVDAQKGRDFFIAEHPETGERVLVYVAPSRDVLAFDGTPQPKAFGRLAGSTGPKTGAIVKSESGAYRLSQATTKEIEAQAQTRYIKSVMANRLDNLAKLRSAVRNAKYIDDLKADPAFPDYFKPAGETPVPPVTNGRTWRRPNLPQFAQYYVEPRIADALDDFARTSRDAEGLNRALSNIGRVMNAVMFINPKAHIDNVLNHMLIGRGLVGNVTSGFGARYLVRGAREVWNLGPEYRRALKAGLSLPYARIVAGDIHAQLLMKLGQQAAKSPAAWNRLALQFGYPSAKIMLRRWSQVPNRVLWAAQDAMMMSRVLELKERGIPLERAIRTAEKEIPNYRVPGQVIGKGHMGRGLAELFGNPAFGRFGRYQFGRLRAYVDSVKEAFGPGRDIGERAHAFDQMLMLGVYTFGVYAAYDWLWQQITGNPLAYTVRSGASAIPRAIEDVGEGRKKAGDLIQSMFTLGVPIELGSEIYSGRYAWSGQPVIRDADVRAALDGDEVRQHQIGRDAIAAMAREFAAMGSLVNPEASDTAAQTGLRALGVVSPTEEQERAREKARRLDEKSARHRAYKQEAR